MAERSQKDVWRLTPWLAIALLLVNFVLMAFDAREATSGQRVVRAWSQMVANLVQSPVTTISSSVTGFFQSFATMRSAQSENDQLKQRIQELEVEVKQKEDLATENSRLKNLLDLKEQSTYKILTAKVIGRDASVWFDSSIINRGSLDGVELNMPVIADGGIVGRVTAVSPLTAQVDLITRNKSGLGGVIGEVGTSNALGVVSGTSKKDLLEMKYVPGSVEVKVGDKVYTSGQDGIFPAGFEDRRDCRGCFRFDDHAASDFNSSGRTARFDSGSRRCALQSSGTTELRRNFAERGERKISFKFKVQS